MHDGGGAGGRRQKGKAAAGEPGRRGRRRDRERRGSGGQALPANQRRSPELQKTEPRSPGLAGAPSRVWGSPRTGAAVP